VSALVQIFICTPTPTATLFAQIKKEREIAMAIITQEKMKSFKASVRAALLTASSIELSIPIKKPFIMML
jgi:hypothetical protein